MGKILRFMLSLATMLVVALATLPSHAFCGFYVNTGEAPLYNEATRVVLMRDGLHTVLSIQNDYKGPPENFALVVPVPVVLERENVRTLEKAAFDRVDKLSSPRLVEYWEQDPCLGSGEDSADNKEGGTGARAKTEEGSRGNALVKVEREFSVDEYDIVVLSALDSTALETWLRQNDYKIPANAEPYLRPYVQEGSKFFVARVNVERIHFQWGRAALSPLRFNYDTPAFTLPVRLGLINSKGTQDLIVHIIAAQRYEVANYDNLLVPTNLGVKDVLRTQFNAFYASLFDQAVMNHPHAIVTEYAWSTTSCDPCPEGSGPLSNEDMTIFGGDVIGAGTNAMTLTRLHARYGKESAGDDLVFRVAKPLVGGREYRDAKGMLEPSVALDSGISTFQARYVIRHKWEGRIACRSPRYGVWGPPPMDLSYGPIPTSGAVLARRDLDAKALTLDPAEESIQSRSSHDAHSMSISDYVVGLYDWVANGDSDTRYVKGILIFGVGFMAVGAVARRRKIGVLASLGIFGVLFGSAFALAVIAEPNHHYNFVTNLLRDGTPICGLCIGAAGVTLLRNATSSRWSVTLGIAFGLAPLLAGIIGALQSAHMTDMAFVLDASNINPSQAARITSEGSAETIQPVVLGALRSGLLILIACGFAVRTSSSSSQSANAVWKKRFLLGTMGVAAITHVTYNLHRLDSFDGAILVSIAVSAFLMDYAIVRGDERINPIVFAAIGVPVLLESAGGMRALAAGLGAISGESVESIQRLRILDITVGESTSRATTTLFTLVIFVVSAALRILKLKASAKVRTPTSLVALALMLFAIVAVPTTLRWSDRLERIREIGIVTNRLSGDPSEPPQATSPALLATHLGTTGDVLRGPAIMLDHANNVYGSTTETSAIEPYTSGLFDRMADSAADSALPPLLVVPPKITLDALMTALEPLFAKHQLDYRLTPRLDSSVISVGVYAPILLTQIISPKPIELARTLTISNKALAAKRHQGVGFVLVDGHILKTVLLMVDANGYRADGSGSLGELDIDKDDNDNNTLVERVVQRQAADLAVVAALPNTTIEVVDKAVGLLTRLSQPNPRMMGSGAPLFHHIIVTTAQPTLASLLKPL